MLTNHPAANFTQTLPKIRCVLTVQYGILYTQENERGLLNAYYYSYCRALRLAYFFPVYGWFLPQRKICLRARK